MIKRCNFFIFFSLLLVNFVFATSLIITGNRIGQLNTGKFVRSPHQVNSDTIHVLALRAEFIKDTLPTSTGDGSFDLSSNSKVVVDPPPHNRTYFQNQLLALTNYFRRVSRGKLIVAGTVYPKGENDAYKLPNNLYYYSGAGKEDLVEHRWSELLRDAVTAADQADSIDFSSYQSIFVFHAGVGNDFQLDFDPTPFDIKSVFLDSISLTQTLGDGIPVNNGSHLIYSGLILPETESQEGLEIGLLGTMTLLFGAQLGLPSLNDTDRQRPGIGRWGLMDQGSANLQGLVPAEPCAWSKIYLGWEESIELANGENLQVAIRAARNNHKIYKIPINAREYFLIENRQRDPYKVKMIVGQDASGNRVELHEDVDTGNTTLKWPSGATSNVIVSWSNYDFGLPGSGILIWHIDDNVIEANIKENQVNANRNHRGVNLVECDGAQDIGYDFGLFSAAAGAENGDYWDPYWSGNESHKKVNENEQVELSPFSIPNSSANDGSVTHIHFYNFSDNDTVMTFSVRSDLSQNGFPQDIGGPAGQTAVLVSSIQTSSGDKMIVLGKQNGQVLAWHGDGTALLPSLHPRLDRPRGFFANATHDLNAAVIVGQMDEDSDYEILAAAGNQVIAWKNRDQNGDGEADTLFTFASGGEISTDLIAVPLLNNPNRHQVAFGTRAGQLEVIRWSSAGVEVIASFIANSALAGLAVLNPATPIFYATTESGQVFFANLTTSETGNLAQSSAPAQLPVLLNMRNSKLPDLVWYAGADPVGPIQGFRLDEMYFFTKKSHAVIAFSGIKGFSAGDPDGDGYPELTSVIDGRLVSLEGGTFNFTTNFPITISQHPTLATIPITYDIDNDGLQDLIAAIPEGQIVAFNGNGRMAAGFPLAVGAEIKAIPAIADLDNDGDLELIVATEDGHLYVYDFPAPVQQSRFATTQYSGDARHTGFSEIQPDPAPKSRELVPEGSLYCYPNPSEDGIVYIRYQLGKTADEVTFKIYDIAGDLVDSFKGAGLSSHSDHEVIWNVHVESGVYFVRLEAIGAGEKSVAFTKVAIVR